MTKIQTLSFSINKWDHLYSLQKAISHNDQLTGRQLSIHGRIIQHAFLANKDTPITIDLLQVDNTPEYTLLEMGKYQLGNIQYADHTLKSTISVDRGVFEELRKNLMEYGDIEGIHIIVKLGLVSDNDSISEGEQLALIELDYAMKGDA